MGLRDKLLSFDGRLRRRSWWILGILLGLVQWIAEELTIAALDPQSGSFADPWAEPSPASVAIRVIAAVVFLWPNLALSVKRAHDRDHSGLPAAIVTVVVTAASLFVVDDPAGLAEWMIIGVLIAGLIWLVVVLGVLDGTPGPNRYGPSPKSGQRQGIA